MMFIVQNSEDPLEDLEMFFDEEWMKIVCTETVDMVGRIYGSKITKKDSHANKWYDTDELKMSVCFVIFIYLHQFSLNCCFSIIHSFWLTNYFFSDNLFYDPASHPNAKSNILKNLTIKFCSSYNLDRDISIDESLMLYKVI